METLPIEQLDGLDLTNVDTNRALIKDGALVKAKFSGVEMKKNSKGTGNNAIFKFTLVEPAPSSEGKTINPGFVIDELVSLVETDNYDPTERIARIQECFTGKKGKWVTNEILNLEGSIRMKVEDNTQYGKRNRVAAFIKKKTEAAPTIG